MDAINLMGFGTNRLNNFDLAFVEKTQRILSFLRSKGVIPIKRASVNSSPHTTYSAMLATENPLVELKKETHSYTQISSGSKGKY